MNILPNIHPGEVLQEEFLRPMNITVYRLAKDIGVPQTRLWAIVRAKRRITADTAVRLSRYFGNSVSFWIGLQNDYDIEEVERSKSAELAAIRPRHRVI